MGRIVHAFFPAMHRASRLIDWSLIMLLAGASFAAVLRVGLVPVEPSAGVAVVYAPWTTANETLTRAVRAGARFVRFGGFDFIAVVMPEDSDYVQRVLADSALLVVDPRLLAACFPSQSAERAQIL
jgi:hypothetical protein